MDQALSAHVKILDYSCSQERDAQKTIWLDKCVEELKNSDKWALPALKQIREICCLYEPNPNIACHGQRNHHYRYIYLNVKVRNVVIQFTVDIYNILLRRQDVIERLQAEHTAVILVTNSLTNYMDKVRQLVKENPDLDANTYMHDGRYNHIMQVQERLNFLRFLLKVIFISML